jgi:hypothetical protein
MDGDEDETEEYTIRRSGQTASILYLRHEYVKDGSMPLIDFRVGLHILGARLKAVPQGNRNAL